MTVLTSLHRPLRHRCRGGTQCSRTDRPWQYVGHSRALQKAHQPSALRPAAALSPCCRGKALTGRRPRSSHRSSHRSRMRARAGVLGAMGGARGAWRATKERSGPEQLWKQLWPKQLWPKQLWPSGPQPWQALILRACIASGLMRRRSRRRQGLGVPGCPSLFV